MGENDRGLERIIKIDIRSKITIVTSINGLNSLLKYEEFQSKFLKLSDSLLKVKIKVY